MDAASAAARGTLRVYLGAAPGVGKTVAMLHEGYRRRQRGTDVVVGFVEPHGRPMTTEAIGELEVVRRSQVTAGGTLVEEMDLAAILARAPRVALVDELAHTNVSGSRNTKRWQDVVELLDAGIDVISTVNIQHFESINDVVERITGVREPETLPDEIVRNADQVELVDMTPEALRRRMAHGHIYPPEKVDAALANYFRAGNLAALRELALLWVADQVDIGLESYRERHGIHDTWETRERIVVALTGAPSTEDLIRRAARIAQRAHGDLLGVHILAADGLAGGAGRGEGDTGASGLLEKHRKLLTDMGGEYHEVAGADVGAALVEFARAENATQLVLGASQRSRWAELVRGSVINRAIRTSGPIDVHVISGSRPVGGLGRDTFAGPRRRIPRSPLSPRRQGLGWALALGGAPMLTLTLAQLRSSIGLPTALLLYLALVVGAAAVGGTLPALVAALACSLLANFYFTPPFHRLTIASGEHVVALIVFLGVALVVSRFVVSSVRRSAEASRARSEARTLAGLAATMVQDDPLPLLLDHVRSAFSLQAAAVLHRTADGWTVEARAGDAPLHDPAGADLVEELAPDVVLGLVGRPLAADDRAVLKAFAAQLSAVLERTRLRAAAGRAETLAQANRLRAALLQAVSHDLRTPLASIKASVTSLAQPDVEWSRTEEAEFLQTIETETDRLTVLVGNLLDMSRVQAGVLQPALRPVAVEEVVAGALASLGRRAALVDADTPETLPLALADAALLERALANVVDNAVRFTPPGRRVRVEAGAFSGNLDIRVVDRGPGIPLAQRNRVFQPFQRLGDNQPGTGVGLGLAVASGFLAAMGAAIEIDDTPGGGATVVISVPLVPRSA